MNEGNLLKGSTAEMEGFIFYKFSGNEEVKRDVVWKPSHNHKVSLHPVSKHPKKCTYMLGMCFCCVFNPMLLLSTHVPYLYYSFLLFVFSYSRANRYYQQTKCEESTPVFARERDSVLIQGGKFKLAKQTRFLRVFFLHCKQSTYPLKDDTSPWLRMKRAAFCCHYGCSCGVTVCVWAHFSVETQMRLWNDSRVILHDVLEVPMSQVYGSPGCQWDDWWNKRVMQLLSVPYSVLYFTDFRPLRPSPSWILSHATMFNFMLWRRDSWLWLSVLCCQTSEPALMVPPSDRLTHLLPVCAEHAETCM